MEHIKDNKMVICAFVSVISFLEELLSNSVTGVNAKLTLISLSLKDTKFC